MNKIDGKYPIADLHCDMLDYLSEIKNAGIDKTEDIGCAVPYLFEGNVKFQVMAIYTAVEKNSTEKLIRQSEIFGQLINDQNDVFSPVIEVRDTDNVLNTNKIGLLLSIENASGLCNEEEPLNRTFSRFDDLIKRFKSIMYISLTHNDENRFGGGNNSTSGLKDDGKELLNYLSNKQIAVDLSHTSDALAHDIINQIDKHKLNLPIIASHSNSRSVFNHVRNLPDELISEIVDRKGLIGINFLRAFVNYETPDALIDHIEHLYNSGCSEVLSFGADFFYTFNHPDPNRFPFYFNEHMNATKYQDILSRLRNFMSEEELEAIAYKNFTNFIQRLYSAE